MIGPLATVLVPLLAVLAFFILVLAVAKRYRKVGPNQVMVISGRKHKIKLPDGSFEQTGYASARAAVLCVFTPRKSGRPPTRGDDARHHHPRGLHEARLPIVVDGVAQVKIPG